MPRWSASLISESFKQELTKVKTEYLLSTGVSRPSASLTVPFKPLQKRSPVRGMDSNPSHGVRVGSFPTLPDPPEPVHPGTSFLILGPGEEPRD